MSARTDFDNDWTRTRWAHEPHIRVGDPCHDCGTPLVPASRRWWSWTIPPGHSKHAGLGLCGSCAGRRRRSGPLDPTAQQ